MPVVAIFTKFDALEDVAYGKLTSEGIPPADAVKQTADRAVADFEREYLSVFDELKFPPKGRVYLRGNARIPLFVFMATQINSISRYEQTRSRLLSTGGHCNNGARQH